MSDREPWMPAKRRDTTPPRTPWEAEPWPERKRKVVTYPPERDQDDEDGFDDD